MNEQIHPNLFVFDRARTADGLLFATGGDRCRYLGKGWIQFRMMVRNQRSKRTVHNCEGRVARVESQVLTQPFVEKVPLTWAFKNDLNRTDLQDGQALPLNVIILRQYANGQSTAQFISTSDANNPIHPFNLKGEYQCTIVVSSEETRPMYVDFIFDWTCDWMTAKVKHVKISDRVPRSLTGEK